MLLTSNVLCPASVCIPSKSKGRKMNRVPKVSSQVSRFTFWRHQHSFKRRPSCDSRRQTSPIFPTNKSGLSPDPPRPEPGQLHPALRWSLAPTLGRKTSSFQRRESGYPAPQRNSATTRHQSGDYENETFSSLFLFFLLPSLLLLPLQCQTPLPPWAFTSR